MKTYSKNIVIAILSAFLLNACIDEDVIKTNGSTVEEGIPTVAELNFSANAVEQIVTRGAISTAEEYKVYDLHLFVFKEENGEWITEINQHFKYDELTAKTEVDNEGNGHTTGKLSVEITSGRKSIYAIANTEDNNLINFSSSLDKIQTLDDFKKLTASLKKETIDRQQGHLVMSGAFLTNNNIEQGTEGLVEITPEGKLQINNMPISGYINLKRIDTRITFNITAGTTAEGHIITFEPKDWQVVNIPRVTYVHEQEQDAMNKTEDYISASQPTNFEMTNVGDANTGLIGGSFVFYMFENRKEPKEKITNKDYFLRQKENKNTDGTNKETPDYKYADEHATYVVMTGSYYEKDGGNTVKSATVKYVVHLGYVGEDPNDYKSRRNYAYTYNVTIKGVKNIEVEVQAEDGNEQEKQPGAEGDIIVSDQAKYVDAHYETTTIEFYRDKLSNKAGFRVKTPFDPNGIYETEDNNTAKDYKWVRFVRNDKSSKKGRYYYNTTYKPYPGDNNIRGFKYIDEIIQEVLAHKDDTNKGGKNNFFDQSGKVVYTAFIDEFYYEKDPVTSDQSVDLWKKFVNVPNREMHILCDTKYSTDQESSLTTSNILISQRSIKTFYKTDDSSLKTAWGIETKNETGKLGSANVPKEQVSSSNGRYNMYKHLEKVSGNSDNKWSYFVNNETNTVNRDRNNVQNACLQRNRDLNGDGEISPDEIKWYLPAINQYVSLWIGKDGLPSEVHLIQNGDYSKITASNNGDYHFMSSNDVMFWAEEGCSTGGNSGKSFDMRCVRNLGGFDKGVPSKEKEPQEYLKKEGNTIIMEYLNDRSMRGEENFVESGELAVANELSPINRPYRSFKVAKEMILVGKEWKETVEMYPSPCATYRENGEGGWRMPNQREIAIMRVSGYYTDKAEYAWSRTSSVLSYKNNCGFALCEDILTLPGRGMGYKNYVRCIKDSK